MAKRFTSAFDMILEWSMDRPMWQRDALRRIVSKGALDEGDRKELLDICRAGLGGAQCDVAAVPLAVHHVPPGGGPSDAISLVSISEVMGVNRLAPEQELPFQPTGINVIYGDNGVGKSGYARILKRACRARFPGSILGNAFEAASRSAPKATIAYAANDQKTPVVWLDGDGVHPVLSAVSVFDRDCARVHVQEKHEVAFRPFGLDVPDELAAACTELRKTLEAEERALAAVRDSLFARPTFGADTVVGKALHALTATTDLAPLRSTATLSDEEKARLQRLNEDLGRDLVRAAAEQRALATGFQQLALELDRVLTRTSDASLLHVSSLARDAKDKRGAADLAATAAFGDVALKGVGEQAWRALWEAARRYSDEVAYPAASFPQTGDALCVLCQQPVGEGAHARMGAFEAFVKADTERHATAAERALKSAVDNLANNPVRLRAFPTRHQVGARNKALMMRVLRALAAARVRRAACLRSVVEGSEADLVPSPPSPVDELRAEAKAVLTYADELTQGTNLAGRRRLEAERDELRDRAALVDLLPKAEAEVARLASIALIKLCLREMTTNTVTTLGNRIADEVITPKVRDRFQEEIQKLAASRVRVELVRSGGRYGSPQYQVQFFANPQAKVGGVLSEGEQTCVALAAFMTELATAEHGSALVFDDPVTSLDHKWRLKVAERLVEEASARQIIVFTHDLVFLSDLQTAASKRGTPAAMISLVHSSSGAGVVHLSLPWIGAKVKERLDKLEKDTRALRPLYDSSDDEIYAEAVSGIYNRLRSTWERALEDVAFCNVIHRHRDYINTKDLAKVTAFDRSDAAAFELGFKRCCDQVDAHDPSRGRNASPPPPDDILKDVQEVRVWVDALQQKQKVIA